MGDGKMKRPNSLQQIGYALGEFPLAAELDWYLRQRGKPIGGLKLDEIQAWLPAWRTELTRMAPPQPTGKRILLFGMFNYWIQHTALLGMALAGLGNRVELAYLPYASWQTEPRPFHLRKQNLYIRGVLDEGAPYVRPVSWYGGRNNHRPLPAELQTAIERTTRFDVQYTRQVEKVDLHDELYQLRLRRNTQAAAQALAWFTANKRSRNGESLTAIIPNGSILEFGAVYQAARYLEIPVVTYEFGEQRERIWFTRNGEVMRQDTDAFWEACAGEELDEEAWLRVRELFTSRQKASLWENFARRWQAVPSTGGEQVRSDLGLDERPIALLAANVIGDSLTLGRQVFSVDMTEWLVETLRFFANSTRMQLVVRIHPGERYTKGPSVADIVRQTLPELPDHIHLVAFDAPVNTYDLIQTADLGLVYTTTVGMEMAMSGVPVIVAGQTHYRGKGFTGDPSSWETYFKYLARHLSNPPLQHLSKAQVERAWAYAYHFFFEYPLPFPWHLLHMPADVEIWPLARVLGEEGQTLFGDTFRYLVGEPRPWGQQHTRFGKVSREATA
jgi:hypothetical protein